MAAAPIAAVDVVAPASTGAVFLVGHDPSVLDNTLTVLGWGWSFYDSEGDGQFGKPLTPP